MQYLLGGLILCVLFGAPLLWLARGGGIGGGRR